MTSAPNAPRHTIVVELRDRPGALYRAIGLVRRRGYNVSSLTVAPSERAGISRMVLVVEAADVRQVVQQFQRLVDVVAVREEASPDDSIPATDVIAASATTSPAILPTTQEPAP